MLFGWTVSIVENRLFGYNFVTFIACGDLPKARNLPFFAQKLIFFMAESPTKQYQNKKLKYMQDNT
jgi:hypothetical protein